MFVCDSRFLRCFSRSVDDDGSTVCGLVQRLRAQVSIPLCHLCIRVPEDILHLVKRPATVHEEGCESVTEVMNAQMR